MITVISPAKKLNLQQSARSKLNNNSFPQFSNEAQELNDILKKYTISALEDLMKISTDIATLNQQRYQDFNYERKITANHYSALFTFAGEVYNGLDVNSFSQDDLLFSNDNLRILSGLYGILRPLDFIQPYRLEMGSKLANQYGSNLYKFWQDKITNYINDLTQDYIVNLASTEYFKVINEKKLTAQIITPIFKDYKNGDYRVIMMYAKNTRGLMANHIIKNQITKWQELTKFTANGYKFNSELSELADQNKKIIFTRKI